MLFFPPSSFFTPGPCFSFFPLSHSLLAPGHLLLHPLLSGQHGPRDEHLPAPTTRNGLKRSNVNLSMDICGCGCVLGYLGMARSKKALLGIFIYFPPPRNIKNIPQRNNLLTSPHILHVQVSPNMPSINFIL